MIARRWMALALGLALLASRAEAVEIKEVITPLGIKAWLVEDSSASVVALSFSFASGSASDPTRSEGADQPHGAVADRWCGTARCPGLQAAPGRCVRCAELRGLPRICRRFAAPAVRVPRRGVRAVAAGRDRPALRSGPDRATPGADDRRTEPGGPASGIGCPAHHDGGCVCGTSLRRQCLGCARGPARPHGAGDQGSRRVGADPQRADRGRRRRHRCSRAVAPARSRFRRPSGRRGQAGAARLDASRQAAHRQYRTAGAAEFRLDRPAGHPA